MTQLSLGIISLQSTEQGIRGRVEGGIQAGRHIYLVVNRLKFSIVQPAEMSSDLINIAKLSDGGSSEPQIQHRLDVLNKWNIPLGSKILEIGCGQGDFTLVAAYIVGDQGHVTGIDPAPLDYGLFHLNQ